MGHSSLPSSLHPLLQLLVPLPGRGVWKGRGNEGRIGEWEREMLVARYRLRGDAPGMPSPVSGGLGPAVKLSIAEGQLNLTTAEIKSSDIWVELNSRDLLEPEPV